MGARFRLYPATDQVDGLVRHCDDARKVWNTGLAQRNYWRPGMAPLTKGDQERSLTEARAEFGWLAEGSIVV